MKKLKKRWKRLEDKILIQDQLHFRGPKKKFNLQVSVNHHHEEEGPNVNQAS